MLIDSNGYSIIRMRNDSGGLALPHALFKPLVVSPGDGKGESKSKAAPLRQIFRFGKLNCERFNF
jgi:hypothetical protein